MGVSEGDCGDPAPTGTGLPAVGAADAGREGKPDGVPSRRGGLSLFEDEDVGPGEPERETGPVALPERCFDLCFFLRIDVSVPLPASLRISTLR